MFVKPSASSLFATGLPPSEVTPTEKQQNQKSKCEQKQKKTQKKTPTQTKRLRKRSYKPLGTTVFSLL